MRGIVTATAISASTATMVSAGGLDRSGQPIGILFRDGNYAEFSVTHTSPTMSGRDLAQSPPGFPFPYDSGDRYSDVSDAFTSYSFGVKYDVNDKISVAVIGTDDYGSDISYKDIAGSLLGGTSAQADTYTLSLIARYKLNENFSFHAGLRRQTASGEIKLNGLAYGGPTVVSPTGAVLSTGASGYKVKLENDIGYGYLIGGAYELPEYALRLAVTYYSPIEHDFKTRETVPVRVGSPTGPDVTTTSNSPRTKVNTPEAVNVDFQTGVAANTLLFGSVRWADWSEFKIKPEQLGRDLVELDNTTTYTIGVAHRFSERIGVSASYIYEPEAGDELVSPLRPTNGFHAVALGASYRIDQVEIAGGVRYTWLGDAKAETGTPDVARASFTDNEAVSVGLRIGYYF